jgi:signal transduction histidine kinase
MRFSLRKRVFLTVAAVNVAVFAAGGWRFVRALVAENTRAASALHQELARTLRRSIRPEGDVNVSRILRWPGWDLVQDAILIDRHVELSPSGNVVPRGVFLNPVGSSLRGADFATDAVLLAVKRAADEGQAVADIEGGWAVPVEGPEGIWGGCWYRRAPPLRIGGLVRGLLLGYVGSTLLLTAATFLLLRQIVLDPVDELVEGAHRVRAGDLAVRLEEPHRRDEIADLVRSFNQMASTLEGFSTKLQEEVARATDQARRAEQAAMTQRRLAAMGELAAGIAHEINNPLGGLQNAVRVLGRESVDPDKRRRYLALLDEGLGRIQRTVSQLLRFTPRRKSTEPVDLVQVCFDAAALVRHRAAKEGVRVALRLPGRAPFEPGPELPKSDVPRVPGSRDELGQAVLNLLVNALDAVGESTAHGKARVDVELELAPAAAPTEVVVRVRDNGPGVAEDDLGRIADLFFTTKEVGRGTGLGLAIAANVADAHGGRLSLENTPGGGFSAELHLPLATGDGRAGEAPPR